MQAIQIRDDFRPFVPERSQNAANDGAGPACSAGAVHDYPMIRMNLFNHGGFHFSNQVPLLRWIGWIASVRQIRQLDREAMNITSTSADVLSIGRPARTVLA